MGRNSSPKIAVSARTMTTSATTTMAQVASPSPTPRASSWNGRGVLQPYWRAKLSPIGVAWEWRERAGLNDEIARCDPATRCRAFPEKPLRALAAGRAPSDPPRARPARRSPGGPGARTTGSAASRPGRAAVRAVRSGRKAARSRRRRTPPRGASSRRTGAPARTRPRRRTPAVACPAARSTARRTRPPKPRATRRCPVPLPPESSWRADATGARSNRAHEFVHSRRARPRSLPDLAERTRAGTACALRDFRFTSWLLHR